MVAKTVKGDTELLGKARGEHLWSIMTDAAKNVLERPETQRGPYVIKDNDLRIVNTQPAG